jgi:glutathione synthase
MDPIAMIHYKKDSTLAMLWEAQSRGWSLDYFEQKDLYLIDGIPFADALALKVEHDAAKWYSFNGQKKQVALADYDVILMRKDPPFNENYIYTTHLLEHAERLGVLVVNRPQSLRDFNEKLFATYFPQCAPPTIVTKSLSKLDAFWAQHRDIVCKPLDSMGGNSVFRLSEKDFNAKVIFETLTHDESRFIMAQKFISEIKDGDKRILLVNGEPVPHALARVPQGADWRGNLAVGAKGIVQPLSERDLYICSQVGPMLRDRGLYFAGIDVIGDYLTEINITSPTGIREIDAGAGTNVSAMLMDLIESKLDTKTLVKE